MPLSESDVLLAKRLLTDIRGAIFNTFANDPDEAQSAEDVLQELLQAWENFDVQARDSLQLMNSQMDDPERLRDQLCFSVMNSALAADVDRLRFRGYVDRAADARETWKRARSLFGLAGDPDLDWQELATPATSMIDALGLWAAEMAGPRTAPSPVGELVNLSLWEVDRHLQRIVEEMVRKCAHGTWAAAKHAVPVSALLDALDAPLGEVRAALNDAGWIIRRIEWLLRKAMEYAQPLIEKVRALRVEPEWAAALVGDVAGPIPERMLSGLYGTRQIVDHASRLLARLDEGRRDDALRRVEALSRSHDRWVGPVSKASWIILPARILGAPSPAPVVIAGVLVAWCLILTGDMLDARGPYLRLWDGPQAIIAAV